MSLTKRFLLIGSLLIAVCACDKAPVATINATIDGADDSTMVVLQKLNYNKLQTIDTLYTTPQGTLKYKVELPNESPNFYYLYGEKGQLASVVLLPGDNVTLNIGGNGKYSVEGSEESAKLQEINTQIAETAATLQKLADEANNPEISPAKVKEINTEMGRLYVMQKRAAIKHILSNPHSITSAALLFQKITPSLPIFTEHSDMVIFQRVYDSLKVTYPQSEFLPAILDEISARDNLYNMDQKLSSASLVGFPDIVLPDINGENKMLSELTGKVIILSFWSVAQTEHKMFNNDLLEIYEKYHDKGLEIYQVALDIDKPTWAGAVKGQKLPWINVNDGFGISSPSVATYNITKIPSMFIINKAGDITERDIFEKEKLEATIKKLL